MLPLSQSLYVPFSLCVSVFARVFLCTLLLVCHGVCMTCPLSLVCLSVCVLDCLSQCLKVPFCSLTYAFACTLFYVQPVYLSVCMHPLACLPWCLKEFLCFLVLVFGLTLLLLVLVFLCIFLLDCLSVCTCTLCFIVLLFLGTPFSECF